MSIACTGFERQTEKFLTIYKKSCAIVLNADLNIIPLIRFQQMSRIGIFFNQRFDTGLVYIIKLTVVTTKTGSGIIITTIAYIKKVQCIIVAEDTVSPSGTGQRSFCISKVAAAVAGNAFGKPSAFWSSVNL